jgi:hypothetical protein
MKYELTLRIDGGESGERSQKISIEREFDDEKLFTWPVLTEAFVDLIKSAGFIISEETEDVLCGINGLNSPDLAKALQEYEETTEPTD